MSQARNDNTGSKPGPRPSHNAMFIFNMTQMETGGGAVGGSSAMAIVWKRIQAQKKAVTNPESVTPGTRLHSLSAVAPWKNSPGTLGRGAYVGISSIHMLFGNAFEAQVGHVFNSPGVQQLMPKTIPGFLQSLYQGFGADNMGLSRGEHGYWKGQLKGTPADVMGQIHPPASGPGARVGGLLGTLFLPTLRASAQAAASRNPYAFPVIAATTFIGANTQLGKGVGSVVDWFRGTGKSGTQK